jgi:REP element-mobilizing transposase RayT
MPSTLTSLHFHFVFSTKDRKPFLTPALLPATHAYLGGCIRNADAIPIKIGGIDDHVHILARMKPTSCIADLMRDIKKASSEWLRNEMGQRQFHWQDGYGAFTVGYSQIDAVRQYIATQAEHHRLKTFEDEYRESLKANGVEFDERYLL